MSRRFSVELELPDDVVEDLQDEDLSSKAKEATPQEDGLILCLLRLHGCRQLPFPTLLNYMIDLLLLHLH